MKSRWRILSSQGGTVPMAFLAVVIFWLTVTFASFGLYAQPNASVIAVLFVSALSVAAAVFLLIELDGPFEGLIKISSAPMRFALSQLGQ
jgi:nitric oxide reductase large subunit